MFLRDPFGPIVAEDWIVDRSRSNPGYIFGASNPQTVENHKDRRAIVIGRKGSGKTTLLHMLRNYTDSISCEINVGKDFPILFSLFKDTDTSSYTEYASAIWRSVIWNSAVIAVANRYRDTPEFKDDHDLIFLAKYAENISDTTNTDTKSYLAKLSQRIAERIDKGALGAAAAAISITFDSHLNIETAKSSLFSFLKNSKTTLKILIDTIEFYQIGKNKAAQNCLKGLFHCCADVHRESSHVDCVMFFPDELTNYFRTRISNSILKDFRDSIFLRWDAADLICLSILRLEDNISTKYKVDSLFSDISYYNVQNAQEIFQRLLPASVVNRNGDIVETLTYIIMHTQQTPRHILVMLNKICSHSFEIFDGRTLSLRPISRNEITDFWTNFELAVHEVYSDILSTYRDIYDNAEEVIIEVIPRISIICSDDDLEKIFLERKIQDTYGYSFSAMKEMLVDIGVLGVALNRVGNVVVARYSYLSEQRLILTVGKDFCVHPIFSTTLTPEISSNIVVHPAGSHVYSRRSSVSTKI